MAAKVGISLPTTGAIVDMQGLYGGLELGFGAFLAYCARSPDRARLGLVAGTLGLGGIALSRLVAMAHYGEVIDTQAAQLLSMIAVARAAVTKSIGSTPRCACAFAGSAR